MLSHDLLEGELAGCAADSTLCLYDGAPAAWSGWLQRLHRWTRGDWQLLPWLLPWVQTPEGLRRNPLSAFSRHKLWDNLRRSLLPIGQAGMLLLSALLARPGLFVLALLLPCAEELCFSSIASLRTLLTQLAALPSLVTIQADALVVPVAHDDLHEKRLSGSLRTNEWTRPGSAVRQPVAQWLGAGAFAAAGRWRTHAAASSAAGGAVCGFSALAAPVGGSPAHCAPVGRYAARPSASYGGGYMALL